MINNIRSFLSKRQLWLCLPLSIPYIADMTVTLLGQTSEYWSGAYQDVIEGNPLSNWFLSIHPLAYIFYRICLLAFAIYFVVDFPIGIAKFITTLYFLFHTVGTYSWLQGHYQLVFWKRVIILFFLSAIFSFAYSKAEQ